MNTTQNGIDLSRFNVDAPLGNSTYVTGSITLLSYNSSTDKDLRMGCHARIKAVNETSISEQFIRTIRLVPAGMYCKLT